MGFLNIFVATSAEDSARDRLDADVLAELHHHLDAAAADLVTAGLDPEEAAREARRRFGKLEPVRRRCLHLQTGGHAMLHKLHLAFTCLLTIAVVGFAFQNLMLYRKSLAAEEMSRARMAELQETLRALLVEEAPAAEQQVYVQIGDELTIVDLYHEEVSATVQVAGDGTVLVRPVGRVNVAGMTRQEVETILTAKLSPFYVETSIAVEVLPRPVPPRPGAGQAVGDEGSHSSERPVVVRIGDELSIVDLYNEDVSATKRVAVDGKVLVRPVGWVHVAGLTRQEVEALLTAKLGAFYVQTSITVEVLPGREAAPVDTFAEALFEDF